MVNDVICQPGTVEGVQEVGGGILPPADFVRLVTPIPSRGADYAHHITNSIPPPPDSQHFRRLCLHSWPCSTFKSSIMNTS